MTVCFHNSQINSIPLQNFTFPYTHLQRKCINSIPTVQKNCLLVNYILNRGKIMKSKKIINGVLSVIILASGTALAERPRFGQHPGQNNERPARAEGHQGFMQKGPAFNRARMASRLQLSDEQREEIKAIHEAARDLTQPIADQMVSNSDEIKDLVKAEPYDEAPVQVLATEQGELQSQLVLIQANTKAAIFAIFTDDQKAMIEEERPTGFGGEEEKLEVDLQ